MKKRKRLTIAEWRERAHKIIDIAGYIVPIAVIGIAAVMFAFILSE